MKDNEGRKSLPVLSKPTKPSTQKRRHSLPSDIEVIEIDDVQPLQASSAGLTRSDAPRDVARGSNPQSGDECNRKQAPSKAGSQEVIDLLDSDSDNGVTGSPRSSNSISKRNKLPTEKASNGRSSAGSTSEYAICLDDSDEDEIVPLDSKSKLTNAAIVLKAEETTSSSPPARLAVKSSEEVILSSSCTSKDIQATRHYVNQAPSDSKETHPRAPQKVRTKVGDQTTSETALSENSPGSRKCKSEDRNETAAGHQNIKLPGNLPPANNNSINLHCRDEAKIEGSPTEQALSKAPDNNDLTKADKAKAISSKEKTQSHQVTLDDTSDESHSTSSSPSSRRPGFRMPEWSPRSPEVAQFLERRRREAALRIATNDKDPSSSRGIDDASNNSKEPKSTTSLGKKRPMQDIDSSDDEQFGGLPRPVRLPVDPPERDIIDLVDNSSSSSDDEVESGPFVPLRPRRRQSKDRTDSSEGRTIIQIDSDSDEIPQDAFTIAKPKLFARTPSNSTAQTPKKLSADGSSTSSSLDAEGNSTSSVLRLKDPPIKKDGSNMTVMKSTRDSGHSASNEASITKTRDAPQRSGWMQSIEKFFPRNSANASIFARALRDQAPLQVTKGMSSHEEESAGENQEDRKSQLSGENRISSVGKTNSTQSQTRLEPQSLKASATNIDKNAGQKASTAMKDNSTRRERIPFKDGQSAIDTSSHGDSNIQLPSKLPTQDFADTLSTKQPIEEIQLSGSILSLCSNIALPQSQRVVKGLHKRTSSDEYIPPSDFIDIVKRERSKRKREPATRLNLEKFGGKSYGSEAEVKDDKGDENLETPARKKSVRDYEKCGCMLMIDHLSSTTVNETTGLPTFRFSVHGVEDCTYLDFSSLFGLCQAHALPYCCRDHL